MKNIKGVSLSKFLNFRSLFLIIFVLLAAPTMASDGEKGEKFDPSEMINHHISDAHSWEIYHGLTIHLPVIV
ncbi:MAG: hypothetical protein RJQ14_16915 [Marinoscillum sp.]